MRAEPVTESNLYLFHEGTQTRAYAVFGAHPAEQDGRQGTRFSVWAPHAENIWIEGDFNDWCGGWPCPVDTTPATEIGRLVSRILELAPSAGLYAEITLKPKGEPS